MHHLQNKRTACCLILFGALALSGCARTEELAKAKGPLFALNPDHWQATPQELKAPPASSNK